MKDVVQYGCALLIIFVMIFVMLSCLAVGAAEAASATPAPVVWSCVQNGDVMTCRAVRPTPTRKPLRPTATPAPAYPAPQTWPNPYPAGW